MILAVSSYSCRVRGCRHIWIICNDGSFDGVIRNIESIPELLRDTHEIKEHADEQYEEVYYDYTR